MGLQMLNIYVSRKKGNDNTARSPPTHSSKGVALNSRRDLELVHGQIHRHVVSLTLSLSLSFLTSSPSHLDYWQDTVPVWRVCTLAGDSVLRLGRF